MRHPRGGDSRHCHGTEVGFVNGDVFLRWICVMLRCAEQCKGREWKSGNPRVQAMLEAPLHVEYASMERNGALSAGIAGSDTVREEWPKVFGDGMEPPDLGDDEFIVMFRYELEVLWSAMGIRSSRCNESVGCRHGQAQPIKLEGGVDVHVPPGGLPLIFRFQMHEGRSLYLSGMACGEDPGHQMTGSAAMHLGGAALCFERKDCILKMLPVTKRCNSDEMGIRAIERSQTTDGVVTVVEAKGECSGGITFEGVSAVAKGYAISILRCWESSEGAYQFYDRQGNQSVLMTIADARGVVEFQMGFGGDCVVTSGSGVVQPTCDGPRMWGGFR